MRDISVLVTEGLAYSIIISSFIVVVEMFSAVQIKNDVTANFVELSFPVQSFIQA